MVVELWPYSQGHAATKIMRMFLVVNLSSCFSKSMINSAIHDDSSEIWQWIKCNWRQHEPAESCHTSNLVKPADESSAPLSPAIGLVRNGSSIFRFNRSFRYREFRSENPCYRSDQLLLYYSSECSFERPSGVQSGTSEIRAAALSQLRSRDWYGSHSHLPRFVRP